MLCYFYKIATKDSNNQNCYVGLTTNFNNRLVDHKKCAKAVNTKSHNTHYKVYDFIRNNGGWDSFTMSVLESKAFDTEHEARVLERHYVETLNATLNGNTPSRTQKEYIEDTREHRRSYLLEWRKKNLELKKKLDRDYYVRNKEHILCKYTCACGAIIANNSRLRHNTTQKHQTYLHGHAPEGEEE